MSIDTPEGLTPASAGSPPANGHRPPDAVIEEDPRIPVDVSEGDLQVVTSNLWKAVEERNKPPRQFRYGGVLVRVENGEYGHLLRTMDVDVLRHEVARAALCFRPGKAGPTPTKPPQDVIRDMLATADPPLPRLVRLVEVPVFGRDGSICDTPGFHEDSMLFYAPPPGLIVPPVSPAPDDADIARARALILDEMLGDFPFTADADRAHAVGLGALPFARELIPGSTPLHLVEAPSAGTGKDLLTTTVLTPALGENIPAGSEAHDDDEWRKRITSDLSIGTPLIYIDNIRHGLDSGSLAAALTRTIWRDRLLGRSETVDLPVRCVWAATANNPTLSTEIARRTVRIRLDAKQDRPWQRRSFHHPALVTWARDQRGRLIWAFLTLIQAWVTRGEPSPDSTPLGSYEEWSRVIGGILTTAGISGFLANLGVLYERADREGAMWRELVDMWWKKFEAQAVGTADLLPLAQASDTFELRGSSDRGQRVSFGKQLDKQEDRVFGEYRVERAGSQKRAALWRLVNVVNVGECFGIDPGKSAPVQEDFGSMPYIDPPF